MASGDGLLQNTELALAVANKGWNDGVDGDDVTSLVQKAKVTGVDMTPQRDVVQDESMGEAFPTCVSLGRKNQDFSMKNEIRWSGSHWIPLFNFLGTDVDDIPSAGKYEHYAMIQAEPEHNFTAEGKVNSSGGNAQYHRWNSIKTQAITISSADSGFLEMDVTGIASNLEQAGAGTIFDGATAASEECGRIPFGSLKCWLTTQDAATITTADHVSISGFNLTLSRPIERDFTANNGVSLQWITAEPTLNGLQSEVVMLTLEFNSYNDYDYFTAFAAETEYKLIMQWDDGVVTDKFKLAFPRLKLTEPAYNADGPGRIPLSLTFQGFRAESTPDGFASGEVDPIIVTVQNAEDTKNFITGAAVSA